MAEEQDQQQIETVEEAKASGTTDVELWLKRIKAAKADEKDWHEDGELAVKVYEGHKDIKTRFNLYHSNIETFVPALYNTTPIPDVRRRFGDKDPVGKMGADIIERSVSYSVDQYPFDETMLAAVRAACVPGRGTARVRYKPEIQQAMGPDGQPYETIGYQQVTCEPVEWDDWGHGPATFWDEVPFVYFCHDMTKEDLAELVQGDEEALKRVKGYGFGGEDEKDEPGKGILKTIDVLEIWDKKTKRVIWITEEDKEFALKEQDDPLGLPDFFPVPEPLCIMRRVNSMVPLCPYNIYKPLLQELDSITKRISKLISTLRVRGLVDASMKPDMELLKNAEDGEYIAAKDVSQWLNGGGLEKAIAHWPLDPIVKALQQLYQQRDQVKQTIYEVTGLSDILRGASNPNETATAQNIKSEWGSLRVKDMQAAVARFARDIFRLKAAIISKHFTPENISAMTSLPGQTGDQQKDMAEQQKFMAALQLLNTDTRSYRIDIESDSTVRADLGRKQEQMNLFLQGTAQFSQAIAGLIQGAPQIAQPALPVMVEVYNQFARHFKLGKQAEDAIESLGEKAHEAAQQPPQEDPAKQAAAQKAQADMQAQQAQMQAAQQKSQLEAQGMQLKAQHEERMAQLAEQKAQLDYQIKMVDLEIKREELGLKRQSMQMDMEAKAADFELRQQDAAMNREHAAQTNAIKLDGLKQQQAAKSKPEARQ